MKYEICFLAVILTLHFLNRQNISFKTKCNYISDLYVCGCAVIADLVSYELVSISWSSCKIYS